MVVLYKIFYCCWLFFELGFCWFFIVETKNKSLEETAALFDGTEISKQIVAAGQEGPGNEYPDEKSIYSSVE